MGRGLKLHLPFAALFDLQSMSKTFEPSTKIPFAASPLTKDDDTIDEDRSNRTISHLALALLKFSPIK